MTVFTETMARMVASLAGTGREVCVELYDDHVCVKCPSAPVRRETVAPRKAGRKGPPPKTYERKGPPPKTYEARNDLTGGTESHTLKEWCEIAGDGITPVAMRMRIKRTGTATSTTVRRSKFEKSDRRKRISV